MDKGKVQQANASLSIYKNRIEEFLEYYLDKKILTFKEINPLGEQAAIFLKDFILSGGKRLRAALTYLGYRAVGGSNEENILFASAGMEILHNFFLVHDDIIDKSDFRRNQPTIHRRYEREFEREGLLSNLNVDEKAHFASSMSIIAGDICCALAYEALIESGFPGDKIVLALQMMHEAVKVTAIGEMLDIVEPVSNHATEEEVLRLHHLKTAKYTVECPLHLGAILHDASQNILDSFTNYAIPLGIAFQIRDDILGIFGTEGQLGKPVGSDIEEGKQTLLTVKAFERASSVQRERLEGLMSISKISEDEMKEVRKIIQDTGSLEYSKDLEISLIQDSKRALDGLAISEDTKDILVGIADSIAGREY
jgi:geranylgeranyl diphosphate synthase type I